MDAASAPELNLLMRGGAMLLLVLIAATLWRDHGERIAGRLGATFALGVAAAMAVSAPGFVGPADAWHAVIVALASGAMFVFWLFTRALFDDGFRLRPWHAGAWLMLAGVGVADCVVWVPTHSSLAPAAGLLLASVPVVFALLAIAQALANRHEDLVEGRRQMRTLVVAATAIYTVAQLLAARALGVSMQDIVASSANATGTAALTLYVAWRLLRARGDDLFAAPATAADHATTSAVAATGAWPDHPTPDPRLVAKLDALMTVERIYREPGLTLGALADRMGLPEHKLRKLINQGLGHRNFSAFLNIYRLADAKRWLADREQPDTPILTIAMDAGFQSLGPFNRAFKTATGLTPSEFRRAGTAAPVESRGTEVAGSGIG